MGIFAAWEKHNLKSVLTRNARLPRDNQGKQRGSPCLWQLPKGHPMCRRREMASAVLCFWHWLLRTWWWVAAARAGSLPVHNALTRSPRSTVLLASRTFFYTATRDWPQALSPPLPVFPGCRSGSFFWGCRSRNLQPVRCRGCDCASSASRGIAPCAHTLSDWPHHRTSVHPKQPAG